tara:strand:- start:363 stop:662 length:300 start_codon:yes stop_codon:yes gene_type:complete
MDKFKLTEDQVNRAVMQELANSLGELGEAMTQASREFNTLFGEGVHGNMFDTDFEHVFDSLDECLSDLQSDDRSRDVFDRCKALQKRTRTLMATLHRFS